MALTEQEERALRNIAFWLERDDRALATKLRGPSRPDLAAEWLIIAPLALGLLVTKVGQQCHLAVCAALGVLLAVATPLAMSIWQSHRRH